MTNRGASFGSQTSRKERYWTSSGKNCVLRLVGEEKAEGEEKQRDGKRFPAMVDDEFADAIVKAAKAARAALLHGSFFLFFGAKQVVAEQRDEGHGDESRGHQRAGHDDRQAVEKFAGGAGEQRGTAR